MKCPQCFEEVTRVYTRGKPIRFCSQKCGKRYWRHQTRKRQKACGYVRRARLKSKFGMTEDDYNCLLSAQDGTCAVCKNPPKKRRLAVDHDHKTGKVRGLLCFRCNYGIGFWHDRADLLHAASIYLKRRTYDSVLPPSFNASSHTTSSPRLLPVL